MSFVQIVQQKVACVDNDSYRETFCKRRHMTAFSYSRIEYICFGPGVHFANEALDCFLRPRDCLVMNIVRSSVRSDRKVCSHSCTYDGCRVYRGK
jgi:hypothetical protein